jgi:hypothetical protein
VSGSLTAARRDALATLAIIGSLAAVLGVRALSRRLALHPTPARCSAMLERYADQEARARQRVPQVARVPLDAPEVVRCTHELTDAEVACALASGYADELERCLP